MKTGYEMVRSRMTREKAKDILYVLDKRYLTFWPDERQAIAMAISALEQESCEDAISRADVYKLFERFDAIPYSVIGELPSVTPSRRKGHWITKIDDTAHNFPFGKRVECSECGQRFVTGDDVSRNFCPNCGAEMEIRY